eukprot:6238113-Alexandrium_andersonii.AAC.1
MCIRDSVKAAWKGAWWLQHWLRGGSLGRLPVNAGHDSGERSERSLGGRCTGQARGASRSMSRPRRGNARR